MLRVDGEAWGGPPATQLVLHRKVERHSVTSSASASVRAAKPAEVCLWNLWWKLIWNSIWNLKVPMGKIWWNFGGGLFYLPGKHETFRGEFRGKFRSRFRRKFRKLRSNFTTLFGNFVQKKGGAKLQCRRGAARHSWMWGVAHSFSWETGSNWTCSRCASPEDRSYCQPRGPKDQKNSRFRSRLKISIENEIFERATHRGPIFCGGNGDIEIKIFERGQKCRSRLKISIEIKFFWSLGPLGTRQILLKWSRLAVTYAILLRVLRK